MGGKIAKCRSEGRRLWRIDKDSTECRMKTKLLEGKTTWFKKRKGDNRKGWYGSHGGRGNSKVDGAPPKTRTQRRLLCEGGGTNWEEAPGHVSMKQLLGRNQLWEKECNTCYQGAVVVPDS